MDYVLQLFWRLIALPVVFVCFFIWKNVRHPTNLPPGPRGWPVVGYMPHVTKQTHICFTELADKYGGIVSLWLGNRLTVILSSPTAIRKAYRSPALSGRPLNYLVKVYNPNFTGIVDGSYSEVWKKHRAFALKTMTSFGLGRSTFEDQILTECEHLRGHLSTFATKRSPLDPGDAIVCAISNLICVIVFGKRFEYYDAEFRQILNMLRETFETLVADRSRDYIPLLRLVPSGFVKNHVRVFETIKDYLRHQIRQHEASFAESPRDYIDAFLTEMKKGREDFTKDWLVNILFDFFAAGTETTATSIRWTLLYLALYPDVQNRLHDEIRNVTGTDRDPSFADISAMPYTEAVMNEILRLCSVAPLGLVHSAMEDTELEGFCIPRGADIYFNLWAMHHDPAYWKEPDQFNPERFLDCGTFRTSSTAFMPFGAGYRACMGEQLAKMEFFLVLVTIIRSYAIEFAEAQNPTSLTGFYKLVYEPKPYDLLLLPREKPPRKKSWNKDTV